MDSSEPERQIWWIGYRKYQASYNPVQFITFMTLAQHYQNNAKLLTHSNIFFCIIQTIILNS